MSDIKFTVTAIQDQPISPTGPTTGQVLKYDGTKWGPQDNLVTQINGLGTNEFSATGTYVNIIATEEVLGSDTNVPVKQFVSELLGTNANYNSAVSYQGPFGPIGLQNWQVSIVGIDRNNTNDFYKADLNFLVTTQGISKLMSPTGPVATNLITNGNGTGWNAIATLISNNTHISVQGATGTNWSVYGKVQELIKSFLPSTLADLIVWLRADSGITLSESNVINWEDQSLAGNDVSQSNNDIQPTYNVSDANYNNQPTISLNGSQWLESIGANTYSQPNTIIVCGNWVAPYQHMMVGSTNESNRNDIFGVDTTEIGLWAGAGISSGTVTITDPVIVAGIFNGSTSSGYVNDSQTPAVTGDVSSNSWKALMIGATFDGTAPMTGTVAEVIAYNRVLSSSELQQVFLYLGQKYNIATS